MSSMAQASKCTSKASKTHRIRGVIIFEEWRVGQNGRERIVLIDYGLSWVMDLPLQLRTLVLFSQRSSNEGESLLDTS